MLRLFSPKGPFTAHVNGNEGAFEVAAGSTVLKAALKAGLDWPNSCRVGSCGTCKCRLVGGEVKALNDFSYALSDDDLDAGMILACQSVPRSDIQVEVRLDSNRELSPPEASTGTIDRVVRLTHDIIELGIELDTPLPAYRAGQFAELSVAQIERPRSYSFARAPHLEAAGHLTFHVRLVPGGMMSTWLHGGDRRGAKVNVSGPHGSFRQHHAVGDMLCIAGGSGMAPIKALLECAAERGFDRNVLYLYGARTRQDLYCTAEMAGIRERSGGRFRFVPVLSGEPTDSDWTGARGMVTDQLGLLDPSNVPADAYLCGPPPMVDSAIAALERFGLEASRIHFDKFLDASHQPGRR